MILFILAILGIIIGITLSVGGSLIQVGELLLGVLLGYYVVSQNFRRMINTFVIGSTDKLYESRAKAKIIAKPIKFARKTKEHDLLVIKDINGKNYLNITEETLAEWLKNPEVKVDGK